MYAHIRNIYCPVNVYTEMDGRTHDMDKYRVKLVGK